MRLLAIALRNLSRNRRRTLLSLLVIASGTAALLLTAGFVRFSFNGLEDAVIRGGLGHFEVVPEAEAGLSSAERAAVPGLADWRAVRAAIEAAPEVRAAGGVIHLSGVVGLGDRSTAFLGLAVEPDRERRMGFDVKLREGEDLPGEPPAEGADRVLLGLGLARAIGARPGDVVTIMVVNPDGMLNAVDMTVAGLFTTGLQELDSRLVKLHLASAGRLAETDGVSSIVVALSDGAALEAARSGLERRLSGRRPRLALLDWRSRAPFYGQVRSLYSGIFWFLGGIVFLLVCLSNSNALLMAMMERVREIGTLLALGTSRAGIGALFLGEALWLGLLGALAGDALGLALASAINALRVEMPPPPGAVSGFPLQLQLAPEDFLLATGLMLAVMAVSALLPIARATRLRIVDALGHV
jgi:putative ABC transport system permease protein